MYKIVQNKAASSLDNTCRILNIMPLTSWFWLYKLPIEGYTFHILQILQLLGNINKRCVMSSSSMIHNAQRFVQFTPLSQNLIQTGRQFLQMRQTRFFNFCGTLGFQFQIKSQKPCTLKLNEKYQVIHACTNDKYYGPSTHHFFSLFQMRQSSRT